MSVVDMPAVEEKFETKDLSMAAYLSLMLRTKPSFDWRRSVCWFVFVDGQELREYVRVWSGGIPRVHAKEYAEELTALKSEMFEAKD